MNIGNSPMPDERAITVRDVAREYGVTPKAVYGWIKAGFIVAIRLPGGDYRFRREHLDDFDRCRDTSSSDQTTDSDSEETSGQLTTRTKSPVALDAFRRGRESGAGPKDGGTNG
jgi:excisionase family DNA binding protein